MKPNAPTLSGTLPQRLPPIAKSTAAARGWKKRFPIRWPIIVLLATVMGPLKAWTAAPPDSGRARLVSEQRIWDAAKHNGFPDLLRAQGQWWCCLREGERHVGGQDGRIRIITSKDGETWESAALLAVEGTDLRDPKLSEMPDGRLMIVSGGSIFGDLTPNSQFSTTHFGGAEANGHQQAVGSAIHLAKIQITPAGEK